MNISGIRPYSGFYEYSTLKNNELRSQQIQNAKEQSTSDAVQNASVENSAVLASSSASQNFGLMDYAQQYQPDETFDLKGKDSELGKLDMEQVMNDLQKDKVLQQYQFFVGESSHQNSLGGTNDRNMENFLT